MPGRYPTTMQSGLSCGQETAAQPTGEERQEEMQSKVSSMTSWAKQLDKLLRVCYLKSEAEKQGHKIQMLKLWNKIDFLPLTEPKLSRHIRKIKTNSYQWLILEIEEIKRNIHNLQEEQTQTFNNLTIKKQLGKESRAKEMDGTKAILKESILPWMIYKKRMREEPRNEHEIQSFPYENHRECYKKLA